MEDVLTNEPALRHEYQSEPHIIRADNLSAFFP
jgi:hypothetical protein